MPELSLTLTELAKECKRLGSLADRAEDNELRARKVQTQVDALRSEEGDLRGNIEIRNKLRNLFLRLLVESLTLYQTLNLLQARWQWLLRYLKISMTSIPFQIFKES